MVSPLKQELARRGSEAQQYAGVPPVGQYWLIVENGQQIAQLLTERRWSFRRLAARFNVAPETLKRSVLFISEHEELVASKDWVQLENLLFGRWPDFRTMPFYRDYIQPGTSVAYRKQFRDGKKVGRRVGSKNKPKATGGPGSSTENKDPSGSGGAGGGVPSVSPTPPPPESQPAATPAPTKIVPPDENPAAPSKSQVGDGPDLDLPQSWSAKRAKELAARRP